MDLNQEQIKRLEEVIKSRYPIVRAALTNTEWFSFVCVTNGMEYVYNYFLRDELKNYVLNGEQVKEEPKVESKQTDDDRRPQETSLTPRQWATYRLIKHNSLVEHRKTSQREIYEQVNGYVWNDKETAHDHCPAIWSDINANNESKEHQHWVLGENFEYWIGSKREYIEFLRTKWGEIAPRLHRYWELVRFLGYDGQGRLYDKNLNPISDDGFTNDRNINAELFIKSFNDYDIEMQKEV